MRPALLLLLACGPADDPGRTGPPADSADLPPTDSGVTATATATATADGDDEGGNVLLVLLDDIGLDHVGAYGLAPDPPPTPTLDALAAEGVLFRWAYASPMCSPTRANLMTGRHARRTGVGHLVEPYGDFELSRDEVGLGELVAHSPHGYTSAMAGKWHLSPARGDDPASHPAAMGFDWFAGSLDNLGVSGTDMSGKDYWHWEKNDNGVLVERDVYATVDTTDDAIARIAAMPEPWLLYVAYNGAHMPWHAPPDDLHTQELGTDPPTHRKYDAMVESVDAELGRLLDAIDPALRARTTVVVMGDNGTPDQVITEPFDPEREKGTVYEGGVRVPLVVTGPHVASPGSESAALVHAVDLFATVAEIAGVPLSGPGAPPFVGPVDGISLLPWLADPAAPSGRPYAYAERFEPLGAVDPESDVQMLHDGAWKLIRIDDELGLREQLFRLVDDGIHEGSDLLADGPDLLEPDALAAHERLAAELDRYVAELAAGR